MEVIWQALHECAYSSTDGIIDVNAQRSDGVPGVQFLVLRISGTIGKQR